MINQVLWTIDNELDGASFERLVSTCSIATDTGTLSRSSLKTGDGCGDCPDVVEAERETRCFFNSALRKTGKPNYAVTRAG